MKNKFFLALTLTLAAALLPGCSPYDTNETNYTMNQSHESIMMTIGEARYINLYSLKNPVKLTIQAPKGKIIVYDTGEKSAQHVIQIEPRKNYAYSFLVEETSPKDPNKNPLEVMEFHLSTFKSVRVPEHATEIRERSGKYDTFKGWRINYSVPQDHTNVQLDLNDFNTTDRYEFNFVSPNSNIDVELTSPLGSQFLYKDGTTSNTYHVKLDTKKSESSLYFDLYYTNSKSVYSKRIDINFEGLAPKNSPHP